MMSTAIPKVSFNSATHVLCYPLYNPRAALQLQNLVQRLMNDGQAAGCPQKAFRLPKSFHLPIAKFKFKSSRDVEHASGLLHGLDVSQLLKHAANVNSMANASIQDGACTKATVTGNAQGLETVQCHLPPLYVSLIGLSRRPHYFKAGEDILSTYSVAVDQSNRLQLLSVQVLKQLTSAGLEEHFAERDVDHRGEALLRTNLINTQYATQSTKVVAKNGKKC